MEEPKEAALSDIQKAAGKARKKEADKKSTCIYVRITAKEKRMLQTRMKKSEVGSLSEFIRRKALDERLVNKYSDEEIELLKAIKEQTKPLINFANLHGKQLDLASAAFMGEVLGELKKLLIR